MGYYQALPIYRAAMEAVTGVDAAVRDFPRYHKFAIGQRLRDASLEALVWVQRAHPRATRARALPRLCAAAEELKLLVQAAKEVKAFASFRAYAQVMEQVVRLARQAEAWRAHESKRRPEPRRGA